VTELPPPGSNAIVATGPLTSGDLAEEIKSVAGNDDLAFFDAIAPIVYRDSIDFDIAWYQSRYDKPGPGGTGKDYINLPLSEAQYTAFITALTEGDTAEFKDWEKDTPYFEGCLPIEVMAARGSETLRFGPMKPVGLTNPHSDEKPHAVVQLRQDNALGTLYNMVGFQTKLKHGAQADIFRMIPGLEKARFARLGGIHRNTFINSPRILDRTLAVRGRPGLRFAGQITGVEGYLESAAIGLLAGRFAAAEAMGADPSLPPRTTALGALHYHITEGHVDGGKGSFQPMNVNFGLFPDMAAPSRDADGNRLRGKEKGRARKRLMTARALEDLQTWLSDRAAAA
jgi:methylenetetrahydrofolate--tRNA-(uracil-5-)-methyltransferase